jgi:tellurite resistance protein TehA-like permease
MSRVERGDGAQPLWRAAARGLAAEVRPCAGSLVMGTGIVAVALDRAGAGVASRILLALAAAAWLASAAVLGRGISRGRGRWAPAARTPDVLTAVAATCVLGDGLLLIGWPALALALWILGAGLWLVLLPPVAAGRPWGDGRSFLLAVATLSVASLGAALAASRGAAWMIVLSLALLGVGVLLYLAALARFSPARLWAAGGEVWIAGGALAISALACGELILAIDAVDLLRGAADALSALDLGLWIAAVAWLPLLIGVELRRRRWRYDPTRWATVFPVGMYATSSFVAGRATGVAAVTAFGRVWVWVALAVWSLAALGLVRRAAGRSVHPGLQRGAQDLPIRR